MDERRRFPQIQGSDVDPSADYGGVVSDLPARSPQPGDESFQNRSLEGVSRTFAFTIPQLPRELRRAVANGYLLCRVADTIEDDPGIVLEEKETFLDSFLRTLKTGRAGRMLAEILHTRLSEASLPAERELIRELPRVLRITNALAPQQRDALVRCVGIMGQGMAEFGRKCSADGLATVRDLERYCYHVAGVVGEMLTDLFCHHSPRIAAREKQLGALSVAFGQGLQMTNILKDIRDDLARGACWLPRDTFAELGFDLRRLAENAHDPAFAAGLRHLVGVAHGNLRDAVRYTLLIPRTETGIRRFLMWGIDLAILTLRNIHRQPHFASGAEVKVPRRQVRTVIMATNLAIRSNLMLSALFRMWARGLPLETGLGMVPSPGAQASGAGGC